MTIKLDDALLEYLADLYGVEERSIRSIGIFELDRIENALDIDVGLNTIDISLPTDNMLEMRLNFMPVDAVRLLDEINMVAITVSDETTTLDLSITRENISRLLSITAFGGTLASDVLFPIENSMSEEEYVDYLGWALEEYIDPANLNMAIESSAISIEATLPGKISAMENGSKDGQTAIFRIPLIAIIASNQPLRYSVSFIPDAERPADADQPIDAQQ